MATKVKLVESEVDKGDTLYDAPLIAKAQVRITVEGVAPLLTHSPSTLGTGDASKRGTRIPTPEDEAEAGCYRLDDGTCAIKSEALIGCIVGKGGAAAQWKASKRTTMKTILSHLVATQELLPLVHPSDGSMIKNYTIDVRPVVVQKARVLRARPRYDAWRTSVVIEYDPVLVPKDKSLQIIDIYADAGSRVGIGDYRPRFGRFRVVSYRFFD